MKICSPAGPRRIWGEKGRCLPLHSAPHFSPFLRLFTFILLMIPFLHLILCLHLVSVPPAPHTSYPPFYPSSTLCIDSLCSLSVYEGRKHWDECSGHGRGHFHCILPARNHRLPKSAAHFLRSSLLCPLIMYG